jgi:hypothetical protein
MPPPKAAMKGPLKASPIETRAMEMKKRAGKATK